MKRREFTKQSLLSTATLAASAASAKLILGANDRVRLGLIGCGGRGLEVATLMRKVPGVEYIAVCDVYETNANAAREWAGTAAHTLSEFRKLTEQKKVDAVHNATPQHWHAIPH